MRVDRIQPQHLVKLRIKDRLLYGEVLQVADGIVRFRPLWPPAGTEQQPGKSSGTGAKWDAEQATTELANHSRPHRPLNNFLSQEPRTDRDTGRTRPATLALTR